MGGELNVKSKVNYGSTFELSLNFLCKEPVESSNLQIDQQVINNSYFNSLSYLEEYKESFSNNRPTMLLVND